MPAGGLRRPQQQRSLDTTAAATTAADSANIDDSRPGSPDKTPLDRHTSSLQLLPSWPAPSTKQDKRRGAVPPQLARKQSRAGHGGAATILAGAGADVGSRPHSACWVSAVCTIHQPVGTHTAFASNTHTHLPRPCSPAMNCPAGCCPSSEELSGRQAAGRRRRRRRKGAARPPQPARQQALLCCCPTQRLDQRC
jgi:hypothetical protein